MERDLIGLAMPGSKFIARGAHNGRERMVKAFEDYFSKGGHDIDGSPTIKARYHGHMKFEGVQPADNARFEIGIPLVSARTFDLPT